MHMKKLIAGSLLFAILVTIVACKAKKEGFSIEGTITSADNTWVLLKKRVETNTVTIDSVQVKEGKFTFNGKVDLPEMYFLKVADVEGSIPFFIENSAIQMTVYADSLDKSIVKGSATHDIFTEYQKQEGTYSAQMEDLYGKYMQASEMKDTLQVKSIEKAYDSIQNAQNAFTKDYILKNGKTVVSAFLAISNAYAYTLDDLKQINKAMDASISESVYVKKLAEREKLLSNLQPGMPAPEFTMNDTIGNPVTLSSFKGKVVLVDFWASWCGPCRAENPNVVKAFKKFGPKGFTVLGVSLDKDKDKWIAAIAKDELTWTHVSDLQYWQNAAAKQYGVMSIPANFLLDKEGKIIASDLRAEKLDQKLEEIFAK